MASEGDGLSAAAAAVQHGSSISMATTNAGGNVPAAAVTAQNDGDINVTKMHDDDVKEARRRMKRPWHGDVKYSDDESFGNEVENTVDAIDAQGAQGAQDEGQTASEPQLSENIQDDEQPTSTPQLSKNAQKKAAKKAEREAGRAEWKAMKKAKAKAKAEKAREARERDVEAGIPPPPPKPRKKSTPRNSVQLPVTIVIDCDFEDLMTENELKSLTAQVTRCYSDNRSAVNRAHLIISSFGGKVRERFDVILDHYRNWHPSVRFVDENYVAVAKKSMEWMDDQGSEQMYGMFADYRELDDETLDQLKQNREVVYLTAEADEVLTDLKPYSTYIIGGLVDKNRQKGVCHKRAMEKGIRTARLPIEEYISMKTRQVLVTSHVHEILVKWLQDGDWAAAFMSTIPQRKGGALKRLRKDAENGQSEDEEVTAKAKARAELERKVWAKMERGALPGAYAYDDNDEDDLITFESSKPGEASASAAAAAAAAANEAAME